MAKKQKTKKRRKLATSKTKSHPSNPHIIRNKEVVIKLERLSDSVVAEMIASGSALLSEQTKKRLKLPIPKTKSRPCNPHFICDKEVVIQLERLSDSVVAEMSAGGSVLLPEQVNDSNDDAFGINSLPDEIIIGVFGYLKQNQLGQIARVCRRWNVLTKNPVLWRKVNVKFSPFHGCQTTVAESFINTLSSCVTSIRLDFTVSGSWIEPLDFEVLCPRLREKCPRLEELILIHSELLNSLSSVIGLCTQFLQDVKNLILHYSDFRCHRSTCECFATSKIKILELLNCFISYYGYFVSPFSKMPHLKQLHLYGTNVDDFWFEDDISFLNQLHVLNLGYTQITAETFQAVQNHGLNLKEFYVCASNLEDLEITLNNSVFPLLKTICLIGTGVTCEGIFSLIQSCPSLENVYVYEFMAESFAEHPFVVANRCKSGIVKAIDWYHNHNVHYLHT